MIIKKLIDEDFVNYKKPSMVIAFPHCTFKCDKECGKQVCQNSLLAKSVDINIAVGDVIQRYILNPITKAVVIQGLEPLDDMDQLEYFIISFRVDSEDDIVVYTGYNKEESEFIDFYNWIKENRIKNVIVKHGRFIPNRHTIYDDVLGVMLASDNQKAMLIC